MGLKVGIVGLPNVGKSTLFKALTNEQVEIANYPFATINANVGVVEVPDPRLDKLVDIFSSKKRIATTVEFIDIAGLVKGASKGAGLGNQFLANIREVDAIIHVVRCFDDQEIIHVDTTIDPMRDIETINFELIFADIDSLNKRKGKIEKKAIATKDKVLLAEVEVCDLLLASLNNSSLASTAILTPNQYAIAKSFDLLTFKPIILVANSNSTDYKNFINIKYFSLLEKYAKANAISLIGINAKVEEQLSDLEQEEKQLFLAELGISMSGIDSIILQSYATLGLKTFFTAGGPESRAWSFKEGMFAPECAGIIHSDFQKGFIRAEVYSYDDLIKYGSEKAVKENGKWRLEGKEYKVLDGDILHFRFNV
jgi:GTP-binding protein YchF